MITPSLTPDYYSIILDALMIADEQAKAKDPKLEYSSFEEVYNEISLEEHSQGEKGSKS